MRWLIRCWRALWELLKEFHADTSTVTPARRRTRTEK